VPGKLLSLVFLVIIAKDMKIKYIKEKTNKEIYIRSNDRTVKN